MFLDERCRHAHSLSRCCSCCARAKRRRMGSLPCSVCTSSSRRAPWRYATPSPKSARLLRRGLLCLLACDGPATGPPQLLDRLPERGHAWGRTGLARDKWHAPADGCAGAWGAPQDRDADRRRVSRPPPPARTLTVRHVDAGSLHPRSWQAFASESLIWGEGTIPPPTALGRSRPRLLMEHQVGLTAVRDCGCGDAPPSGSVPAQDDGHAQFDRAAFV